MNAYLILGCNGYVDDEGFLLCNKATNPIIDLSKLPPSSYGKAEKFLDNACGLFDSPCFDYNKCINIINFLYRQFSIIEEDMLHKIQAFIKMHRRCGIYLIILLKEDYNE